EKIAVPSRRDVVIKDPLHDAHRRLVGRVDKHHIERGGDEKDRPDVQSLLRADHRPDHAHTSKTDSYRSAGTAVNKTSNTNSSRSHVPVAGVTSPVTAAVTIATPPKATGDSRGNKTIGSKRPVLRSPEVAPPSSLPNATNLHVQITRPAIKKCPTATPRKAKAAIKTGTATPSTISINTR